VRLIDSHHHVWNLASRPQPWMQPGTMDSLRRDFDLGDLDAAASTHDLLASIVVQTVADTAETVELIDATVRRTPPTAVVGYVDLTNPALDRTLEELVTQSAQRSLVGIRSLVQYEPDRSWLQRPDVLAGFRKVADLGLVHDLLIVPSQIAPTLAAIDAVPAGRYVIDHLAKPDIAGGAWEPWVDGIAALAERDNVITKLSGLVTEADWSNWNAETIRPYAEHALDCFGPGRLMFGSDWPVCTLAASYDAVVAAAVSCTAGLTASERESIFVTNAVRVYQLSDPADDSSNRESR
jgi:L-fuconolactonase